MAARHVPDPPGALPPARTVQLPGRGEVFVRDTGGDGPAVLLLHAAWRLALAVAPYGVWRAGLRAAGLADDAQTT